MFTTATRRRAVTTIATVLGLAAVVPIAAWSSASGDAGGVPELTSKERQVILDATKQFRDVDAAIAAGYVPTEACAELPGEGAMGYHYTNPANLQDGVIDPAKPELLLYYRDEAGRLRLGGVEYFAADADQDLATDDDRPELYGHPFDGPMPGHEPGMPVHYDLHVWLYKRNPVGALAAWNPAISCPTDAAPHH